MSLKAHGATLKTWALHEASVKMAKSSLHMRSSTSSAAIARCIAIRNFISDETQNRHYIPILNESRNKLEMIPKS